MENYHVMGAIGRISGFLHHQHQIWQGGCGREQRGKDSLITRIFAGSDMQEFSSFSPFLSWTGKGCLIKGPWPDHFFDPPTYLKVFEILITTDGSYFSHSHPEIWRSKIGYLRRNNQKRVKSAKCGNHTQ